MPHIYLFMTAFRSLFLPAAVLRLENLALRQQLAILKQQRKRPALLASDRFFWAMLSRIWSGWKSALIIVKPETVVRWHRTGFRLFWRWRSRKKPGRPTLDPVVIGLIKRLSRENLQWGTPRIQLELELLGHKVAPATVAKYRVRTSRRGSSQTWMTFLRNHMNVTAACDFIVVPTAFFQLLYCLVILTHDRRKIAHIGVTTNPTTEWSLRQLREAFPGDGTEPKYLVHDRDNIFGPTFDQRVRSLGIDPVRTSHKSPWQNCFVERVNGTLRREFLNHLIVLSEKHLRRLLREFVAYYNGGRGHLSLRQSPTPRETMSKPARCVVATPVLGGLHHVYAAA